MSLSSLFAMLKGGTSVTAMEHDELQKAHLAGACHIVDVREPHEYAAGHIAGAINHPLSQFDPLLLPKDKAVVLVCQAGGRSARALGLAHEAGRTDVVHYAPGTGGWKARGGAMKL